MFGSLSVDARQKPWHSKVVHRAIAAQSPRLSKEALEQLSALSVAVEVRPGEPAVDLAGNRVVVQLESTGWTSLEAAVPIATEQLGQAIDALLGQLGAGPRTTGIKVRVLDPEAPEAVFDAMRAAIRARVAHALGGRCQVVFDAFPLGSDGLPVDNLDRRAFDGPCRVEASTDELAGYRSRVLDRPTWLEIATVAEQVLKATDERNQIFLEGLTPVRVDDGVTVLELQFGS
jgi:hypothetical protein